MTDWLNVPFRLALITVLIITGIFAVDLLFFPVGVAIAAVYVLPVLVALRSGQRTFVFLIAAACTVLTMLGFVFSPPGEVLWMGVLNRLIAVLAIWVTAFLSLQQRKAEELIQFLRGLLPLCASCKKIRDDKGYWRQVEQYIEAHSNAILTHSICPACVEKWYPDLYPELMERYPELYRQPDRPSAEAGP
jgi:hypothetical protein